jgi:Flp pilus assembly pilin Flp
MKKFGSFARSLARNEDGLTLIEYALGGALISIVAIVALAAVGEGVFDTMTNIAECLDGTAVPCPLAFVAGP